MTTCPQCKSTQKEGTPCRCPFDDDGPLNDRHRFHPSHVLPNCTCKDHEETKDEINQ